MIECFILLSVTVQIQRRFQSAKEFLLSLVVAPNSSSVDVFPFVQYMKCTNLIDQVDETLACVCLHRVTGHEVDEWFAGEPFGITQGRVGVVCTGYKIQPFTD